MAKRRGAKGGRRGRKQRSEVMITPVQDDELKRMTSSDAVCLRGTFIATTTVGGVANFINLNPYNLGQRASNCAQIFSRFRFKWVRIQFFYGNTSLVAASICAIGVLDDVNSTVVPTSISGVRELRCSAVNWQGETIPTEFMWKPVSNDWYYCASDSVSEPRLQYPGQVYSAASVMGTISYTFTYCIVFKGAVDTASLITRALPPPDEEDSKDYQVVEQIKKLAKSL